MPSKRRNSGAAVPAIVPGTKVVVENATAVLNRSTGNIEVRFPGYPDKEYIGMLRFFGGKWDVTNGFWYGPATMEVERGMLTFKEAADLAVKRFNVNIEKWRERNIKRQEWAARKAS